MKKGKFSQGMKLFKYAWDTRGVIYRKVNNVNGFIVLTEKEDDRMRLRDVNIMKPENFIEFGFSNEFGMPWQLNYVYSGAFDDEKEFYRELCERLITETYYVYKDIEPRRHFIEQKNVVEFDWRYRTNDKLLQEVYKEMITDEDFNDLVTCVLELCEYVGRDPDVWLVDYAKDNIKDKQL